MAIYLDSADLDEARVASAFGWVRGVTTNPSLMRKADKEPETILAGLARLDFRQIYYQLVSEDLEDMLKETHKAWEIVRERLVLKLPPTEAGIQFVAKYGSAFPCCVTAVFGAMQALVAREAGARFVAVYVNRATRQMGDGHALVRDVAEVLAGSDTEILAASLKSAEEAVSASIAGAQHITVPFELLRTLSTHPLSTQTIEQFNAEGVGIHLRP